METADYADFEQIKGVLAHAGRVIGSLEVWRLGSLDRPHAARLSQRTRRTTKVHEGLTGIGTADCADFEQIKGVLPHAGLPVCFGNH